MLDSEINGDRFGMTSVTLNKTNEELSILHVRICLRVHDYYRGRVIVYR